MKTGDIVTFVNLTKKQKREAINHCFDLKQEVVIIKMPKSPDNICLLEGFSHQEGRIIQQSAFLWQIKSIHEISSDVVEKELGL